MSLAGSNHNHLKSNTNPTMPLAEAGKEQVAPTNLQHVTDTFDADNKANCDIRPGEFDRKESPQAQVTPHPDVKDTTDRLVDNENPYSPDPIQDSKAAPPLATGENSQNPRAELIGIEQDNPTSTSAPPNLRSGSNNLENTLASNLNTKIRSLDDAPGELSRSSTADLKEELSKYKSIGDSASRLCLELRSTLENGPGYAMWFNEERLRRSIEEVESIVKKNLRSSGNPPNPRQVAQSVDILYRVRLLEPGKSDKLWYQDVPFSGIDHERIEPAETEHISIFDVIIDVDGKIETDNVPPDEKRKTWKGRKDIEFGKDISMTRQRTPAIVIKARKLLSALKRLITYYPSQAGDMSFVAHPYKMLLLYYPMLAAYRSTYKGANQPIPGHLMVTKDKLQLHESASVMKSDLSSALLGSETRLLDKISKDQTDTGNDHPAHLETSNSHLTGEQLTPEQQIEEILNLETSFEVDTKKPWKDHDFQEDCDKDTAYQIGSLLAYLAPTYHTEIVPELNNHTMRKASFNKLWILFQPGVDVYALLNGQYVGFVVLSCETLEADKNARKRQDQVRRVAVTVWNLAYAGQKIYRDAKRFDIPSFEGTRDITSLGIFPTKYLKDNVEKWEKLRSRGEKYFDMIRQNPAHRLYNGHTLERGSKWYKGEVIVDPSGYLENHDRREYASFMNVKAEGSSRTFEDLFLGPRSDSPFHRDMEDISKEPSDLGGEPRWTSYNDIDPKKTEKLTEHQLFLLPQHTLGFMLNIKEWRILDINCIQDLPKKPNSMANLLLPTQGNHKDIVHAVLSEHSSTPADFVDQKGQSRVVLLHGEPGTGKTYTVECVAKEAQRPLLSLTVADLGNKEELMEQRLSSWFRLAEFWQAIILIDEADVFLEERVPGDLRRNCLIAVFLRTMEYYSGILFLTSNRVGQIDSAFASRILMALEYELLPENRQHELWNMFFEMFKTNDSNVKFDSQAKSYIRSPKVTKMKLNGREIRNAIQASILLAREQDKARLSGETQDEDASGQLWVGKDHISQVLDQRQSFHKYRKGVYDMSDEERAWRMQNRNLASAGTPNAEESD